MRNDLPRRTPRGAGNLDQQPSWNDGDAIARRYASPRDRLMQAIGAAVKAGDVTSLLEIASGESHGNPDDVLAYLSQDGIGPATKAEFLASLRIDARRALLSMAGAAHSEPSVMATTPGRPHVRRGRPVAARRQTPAGGVRVPGPRRPVHDDLAGRTVDLLINAPTEPIGGPASEGSLQPGPGREATVNLNEITGRLPGAGADTTLRLGNNALSGC